VAYDEELSDRIRELIGGEAGVTEQKMFGGLVFLVDGHIAVSASGDGGLLVRAHPDDGDALVAKGKAEPMMMGGRQMSGFLRVAGEHVKTKRQLKPWVERGVAHCRSLPPKKKRASRST
jgi:TfoX/Sxy family transcriptional regulator of competence genes